MGCVLALVLPTGESWFVLECCGLVGFRVVGILLSLLLAFCVCCILHCVL